MSTEQFATHTQKQQGVHKGTLAVGSGKCTVNESFSDTFSGQLPKPRPLIQEPGLISPYLIRGYKVNIESPPLESMCIFASLLYLCVKLLPWVFFHSHLQLNGSPKKSCQICFLFYIRK